VSAAFASIDWTQASLALAGVAVGALATTLGTYLLERRRELDKARAAARAVEGDLDDALITIEVAAEGDLWPKSEALPTQAWKEQKSQLPLELGDELWAEVDSTTRGLDLLTEFRLRTEELDDDFQAQLNPILAKVRETREAMATRFRKRREVRRRTTISTLSLFAVAATVAIVLPLTLAGGAVSARSLANSLQAHLPGSNLSTCEHAPGSKTSWNCEIAWTEGSCPDAKVGTGETFAAVALAQEPATPRCNLAVEDDYRLRVDERCWFARKLARQLGLPRPKWGEAPDLRAPPDPSGCVR
jgi:hypothetical protein